jgi:hypothetical protein
VYRSQEYQAAYYEVAGSLTDGSISQRWGFRTPHPPCWCCQDGPSRCSVRGKAPATDYQISITGESQPHSSTSAAVSAFGDFFRARLEYAPRAKRLQLTKAGEVVATLPLDPELPRFTVERIKHENIVGKRLLRIDVQSPDPMQNQYYVDVQRAGRQVSILPARPVDGSLVADLTPTPAGPLTLRLLASRGYQTSQVELPPRVLDSRFGPRLTIADDRGPFLTAFATQDGLAVPPHRIRWIGNGEVLGQGTAFDVRFARFDIVDLSVELDGARGIVLSRYVGKYDVVAGLKLGLSLPSINSR